MKLSMNHDKAVDLGARSMDAIFHFVSNSQVIDQIPAAVNTQRNRLQPQVLIVHNA